MGPGFVVGAPAYAAFCAESGLRDRIAALERLNYLQTLLEIGADQRSTSHRRRTATVRRSDR
jgi:hypothetical protein